MTGRERLLFWIGLGLILGYVVMQVGDILLPFVFGMMVAYFLDPAADKLELWGCSRGVATAIIIGTFFVVGILAGVILLPILYDQFVAMAKNLPQYMGSFREHFGSRIDEVMALINQAKPEDMSQAQVSEKALDASQGMLKFGGDMANKLLKSGMAVLNIFSLVLISPVVSFYMLRDYDRMVAKINSWLPLEYAPVIREQMRLVDQTLSGFIRGVSNVCLILGVYYAIGLSLVGLDFGLLIGFAAGLISFIPYMGLLGGVAISLFVAFFQFNGDPTIMLTICAIFAVGRIAEGNLLTPWLVGKNVHLHAVWLIFGLLVCGSLLGFVGLVIAVPVTAVTGVLIRFLIAEYLKSSLHLGQKVARRKVK